jgi:hypothetical protein
VHLDLPYNAILGRLVLAKFMAMVHYAYNTLKLLGPAGVNSIKADVKGSVHYTERLYEAVATTSSDDVERPKRSAPPSTKQHLSPNSSTLVEEIASTGAEPGANRKVRLSPPSWRVLTELRTIRPASPGFPER